MVLPPAKTEYGPVLAFDSVIGTKVRALADRAVRDLIDVHAASRHRTAAELERLGGRHGRDDFRLEDLRDRLAGADWADDDEFAAYGPGCSEVRACPTASIEELNAAFTAWVPLRRAKVHGTHGEVIGMRAVHDHTALRPLPATPYVVAQRHLRYVGKDCLVTSPETRLPRPAVECAAPRHHPKKRSTASERTRACRADSSPTAQGPAACTTAMTRD